MAAPDFWADREGSGRVAATHRDLKSRLPALYEELARADAELAGASPGAASGRSRSENPARRRGSSVSSVPEAGRRAEPDEHPLPCGSGAVSASRTMAGALGSGPRDHRGVPSGGAGFPDPATATLARSARVRPDSPPPERGERGEGMIERLRGRAPRDDEVFPQAPGAAAEAREESEPASGSSGDRSRSGPPPPPRFRAPSDRARFPLLAGSRSCPAAAPSA